MPILFISLFLSFVSFAGLEKIAIENLNFHYVERAGEGTLSKLKLGFSLVSAPYEVKVKKTTDSFELQSDFLDVTWKNPWVFVFDLEELITKETSLDLGKSVHSLESEALVFRPKESEEFNIRNMKVNCSGNGTGDFFVRLVEDCLYSMKMIAKKVDLPADFILYKLIETLPLPPSGLEVPANDLNFTIDQSNFYLEFYMKYYVYAGLRTWGNVEFQDDYKTMLIRVDKIKFGYFTVTSYVMKKLKEIITNPRIVVEPPYIRVDLEN